jgi:hypothetical protein
MGKEDPSRDFKRISKCRGKKNPRHFFTRKTGKKKTRRMNTGPYKKILIKESVYGTGENIIGRS